MTVPIIAWLWAGLLLGVSFIATPAKFLAPSLSLAEALDVGRATFSVLKWVECAAAVALLLGLLQQKRSWVLLGLVGPTMMILLVQYLVMLPILDARVERILQGTVLPPSTLHWVYTGIELAKIALLVATGIVAYRLYAVSPQ